MDFEGHAYVKRSSVAGRGLFAKKKLTAGELIFRIDGPLVGSIDTARLHDTCSSCYAWRSAPQLPALGPGAEGTVRACGGCKVLSFCDKVWCINFHNGPAPIANDEECIIMRLA